MELSQTYTCYLDDSTFVHPTENELYLTDNEKTIVLNFKETGYQTLDRIIHALRIVRDKQVKNKKALLEKELLELNFQFPQENSKNSSNGNRYKNCELETDW
ncbi:MAG: hypothetical protein MUE44_28750 [Oscillatoriaceae cyanobacterium Prado104]|jgi:hypothetical protein|nr:hypothetical protein [Oscillatoriaceae cyanobacterium Prado104]